MPHERFMRAAIKLAKKGVGRTSPNPAVGAVIVKDNKVISEGYHRKAGLPHAEAVAISELGKGGKGATLYVTLEPCCHFGRTPPCTDAIISAGIKKVVIGMQDPNTLVCGKGTEILRASGIEVITGVLEEECKRLNEPYLKYITTKTPFVILKLASTLDGKIATSAGESKWITGVDARKLVHKTRSLTDAVMVGSGTVLKDDPELTVRLVKGRNPKRVVVDSSFQSPLNANIFRQKGTIVFTTPAASEKKIDEALRMGVEVVVLPASKDGVDLKRVLKELGKREVTSLLVEGGSRLAASLLKKGLVDRINLYMAPMLIGGDGLSSIGELGIKDLGKAPKLDKISVKRVGNDMLIEGNLLKN
ncbi:MAG: bifunctional diaminohydroxyphosphoribosylaminopyrimidine deaminase/5-amino-6-(5-phosphoribosylamino)uracil reductase RibD [Deltaproteobacteria bacterium]|nr:bifunctional diaminohydroxyphosphoribosylaminopyrimidine deaminase/5-amino-6-(5-phosphoribosylamino)uracil reductase RibD [Deltaproteobacteria bacterium]